MLYFYIHTFGITSYPGCVSILTPKHVCGISSIRRADTIDIPWRLYTFIHSHTHSHTLPTKPPESEATTTNTVRIVTSGRAHHITMVLVCDRQYVSASTLHNCDMRRLGHHRILIILTWHRHHRIIHPSVCFQSVIPTTHLCMCRQKHTPSHTLTHPHIAIRSYTKRHHHISPGRGSLAERLPSRMPILLLPPPIHHSHSQSLFSRFSRDSYSLPRKQCRLHPNGGLSSPITLRIHDLTHAASI